MLTNPRSDIDDALLLIFIVAVSAAWPQTPHVQAAFSSPHLFGRSTLRYKDSSINQADSGESGYLTETRPDITCPASPRRRPPSPIPKNWGTTLKAPILAAASRELLTARQRSIVGYEDIHSAPALPDSSETRRINGQIVNDEEGHSNEKRHTRFARRPDLLVPDRVGTSRCRERGRSKRQQ